MAGELRYRRRVPAGEGRPHEEVAQVRETADVLLAPGGPAVLRLGVGREFDRAVEHRVELAVVPSEEGVENLREENVTEGVHWTGDVMYDAVRKVRDGAAAVSDVLDGFGLRDGEYVLVTVHRARNTDDPERLASILKALARVPSEVVFPVHPRTLASVEEYGLRERAERDLTLVDVVGYLDFIRLLDGAHTVATDSGGVQTEAFFLDTPCVTFRMETEWTETVESGWNQLVGAPPSASTRPS